MSEGIASHLYLEFTTARSGAQARTASSTAEGRSSAHGHKLDQPPDEIRIGRWSAAQQWGGPYPVHPIADWRGSFVNGSDWEGRALPCGNGSCTIIWPKYSAFYVRQPATQTTFFGSLIWGKEDGNGLQYMRNRYYNPQTGAFTQQDPIGLAGGLNTYGFANGDPVSYSDPYGLKAEDCAKVECPKNTREAVENKQVQQFAQELMLASMTDSEGVEYGGFVVRGSDGTLSLQNVTRGGVGFVKLGRAPDNAIARIHTHPDHVLRGGGRITFEMPSGRDAANAIQDNVYGIVVTPRNFHVVPVGQNAYHTFPRTQTLMPPLVCSGGCPTPYK